MAEQRVEYLLASYEEPTQGIPKNKITRSRRGSFFTKTIYASNSPCDVHSMIEVLQIKSQK